jgi:hypothetical protein
VAAGILGAAVLGAAAPDAIVPAPPEDKARPENLGPSVPSPADALRLYGTIRDYLVAGAPGGSVPAGGDAWRCVSGVCLTFYSIDGRMVARSAAMTDLGAALVQDASARAKVAAGAAREAFAGLRTELGIPDGTPAAWDARLSGFFMSVEFAGEPTPLLIDDVAQANIEAAPGLEGVGAIFPSGAAAWMFPAQQLAMGVTPADALGACVSRAGKDGALGVTPAKVLRAERGVTLVKFPVVHAVEVAPGAGPTLLYRGHEPIDMSRMTYAALLEAADRVAAHLRGRLDAGPRPELGVYAPVAGTSTPASDPELALALTLAALMDHAIVTHAEGADLVARWLASVDQARKGTLVAQGASILAGERALALVGDGPDAEEIRSKINGIASTLAGTGVFDPTTGFAETIPLGARGLMACAFVRGARATVVPATRDTGSRGAGVDPSASHLWLEHVADQAVLRVLRDTPPGELVSQMPWLGWAAQESAGRDEIPSAPALRTMRDRVWEHQLTPMDAGAEGVDLVGGIVFTKGPAVLPSAATARPVAFLAGAVADERLTTPGERAGELVRVVGALRFLRQLQADESSAWMYADRGRAMGGVRAAPWDSKMAAEASVYTLMAYTRAIAALDAQVKRPDAQSTGK